MGVGSGLEMILSHMAQSCLDMTSYRAIWSHFRSNSIIFMSKMCGSWLNQVLDQALVLVLDIVLGLVLDQVLDLVLELDQVLVLELIFGTP